MLVVIVVLRAFSEISSQSERYKGRIYAKLELYARICALVKQPRSQAGARLGSFQTP